ncbi:MAG: class I SAM-dependent rRNA methyltransferase [Verrucomicrobia bacterium]|nr:MAG: class I SAM-dependent rRNA methyltransferase [Verrucomicrobiota bacterium]TAF27379.1 MAG: class I SAM-dependent rRNA methyltransferase [Verrucomicrobiota bacterium]TAF42330.1 MAG: class I SAM-dependent rRNA methyltransferase [Verrucomicrobiota bacterium]
MAMPPMRHLLEAALARRSSLRRPGTNALRLIDGDGDNLPGLELEDFAGRWLLSTRDRQPPRELLAWLRDQGRPVYWKRLDQQQKESPSYLCGSEQDQPFTIQESDLAFEISFQSGYSQGIFLDQRDNRSALRKRLATGQTLLNTFAYTGAFSVFAASAGATTTTLDLAQPYLDWAKRNFELNGFAPSEHHFCKGDTFHWLARFAKQGRTFDGIVLDPPTFSRDKDGKVFRVEKDYGSLAELALSCLAPGGFLLASTNCRTLSPRDFERQLRAASRKPVELRAGSMPADFTADPYLKSVWVET